LNFLTYEKTFSKINFAIFKKLVSSLNRIRSDNEQYQEYNTNMQHHIQELNDQVQHLHHSLIFDLIFLNIDQSIKSNK
jgi:hypothetical protein